MSASKKLKAASGHAATTAPKDVKGKSKALPAPSDKMDMDERSDNDSDSSQSGADEDEDSDDGNSIAGPDDSMDTEDEIELAQQPTKSKQTLKRKRRAIPTSSFGQALTALLDTSTTTKTSGATPSADASVSQSVAPSTSVSSHTAPDTALLSLKKTSAAQRRRAAEKSEAKAAKAQLGERKEREDRNRVTDVIGGWGGESERALRKVAQRGVVKLFNVIQLAQQSNAQTVSETSAARGTGKPSLPAPSADGFRDDKKKGKGKVPKDNAIGRAKPAALGQEDFLQSIRAGGIVSKV